VEERNGSAKKRDKKSVFQLPCDFENRRQPVVGKKIINFDQGDQREVSTTAPWPLREKQKGEKT